MKYTVIAVYGYNTKEETRDFEENCNTLKEALDYICKREEDYYGPDQFTAKYRKFVNRRRPFIDGEKFIASSVSWLMKDNYDGYIIVKA